MASPNYQIKHNQSEASINKMVNASGIPALGGLGVHPFTTKGSLDIANLQHTKTFSLSLPGTFLDPRFLAVSLSSNTGCCKL